MKIKCHDPNKIVNKITVWRYHETAIYMQIDTKIKWPNCSLGSSWKGSKLVCRSIVIMDSVIMDSEENDYEYLATVDMFPENEWENDILIDCLEAIISTRYGPQILYQQFLDFENKEIIGKTTRVEH
jgi:hypothetical protein